MAYFLFQRLIKMKSVSQKSAECFCFSGGIAVEGICISEEVLLIRNIIRLSIL